MKYIIIPLFLFNLLVITNLGYSQSAGDFRTKAGVFNANWADNMAWEIYVGGFWVSTLNPPTSSSGVITIVNNSSMNIQDDPANPGVNYTASADQLMVETGATLRIKDFGILDLNDGAGIDLKVQGTFKAIGNTIIKGNGLVEVQSGGTMDIEGSSTFGEEAFELKANLRNEGILNWRECIFNLFQNVVLTNNGTLNVFKINGANGMHSANGPNEFINNGTINSTDPNSIVCNINAKIMTNNGIINVANGRFDFGNSTDINLAVFENNGTIDVGLNAKFTNDAIMNFNTSTVLMGLGRFENDNILHLKTNITIPINFYFGNSSGFTDGIGDIIFNGNHDELYYPNFFGPGKLYINSQFDFSGVSGDREIIINPSGTLNFIDYALISGNITNNGIINAQDVLITFSESVTLTNNNDFNISGLSVTINENLAQGVIINNGTIEKNGAFDLEIEISNFTNALGKTILINEGKLINNKVFNNIGTLTFPNSGCTFENGITGIYHYNKVNDILTNGTFNNKGSLILNTNLTVNNGLIFLNSGEISGIGNLTINTTPFELKGTVSGTGAFVFNSVINWTEGTLARNLTIDPSKTLNINTNSTVFAKGILTNNGNVNWQKGNLTLELLSSIFTNNGIVDISGIDPLKICDGLGSFDNFGTVRRTSSGLAKFKQSGFLNRPTGIISGFDVYEFNNVAFINNGTISPGNSPGILALIGDQPLSANSSLNIEILNGSPAGFGYDQLARNSNLMLAGTLNVVETGVVPNGTYEIIHLTSGTISGSFATINLPPSYSLMQTSSSVNLIKTTLSICSSIMSGQWNNPAIWDCGQVPDATKNVIIVSGHTVALPASIMASAKNLTLIGILSIPNNSTLTLTP